MHPVRRELGVFIRAFVESWLVLAAVLCAVVTWSSPEPGRAPADAALGIAFGFAICLFYAFWPALVIAAGTLAYRLAGAAALLPLPLIVVGAGLALWLGRGWLYALTQNVLDAPPSAVGPCAAHTGSLALGLACLGASLLNPAGLAATAKLAFALVVLLVLGSLPGIALALVVILRAARRLLASALLLCACGDAAHDGVRDAAAPASSFAADAGPAPHVVAFRKLTLHREFSCEGTAHGDLDGDGHDDVVAGPRWYRGPDFSASTAIWDAEPADVRGYSTCFFEWTRDFDGDGALDLLVVGFPGQDASWFHNPGHGTGSWTRHRVIAAVDMESPAFLDLTGDGAPELLFASGNKLGWAGPGDDPAAPWLFHPLSDAHGFGAFSHGLGAADVDGDGRLDVLEAAAWWQQPAMLDGDPVWQRHEQAFGSGGGQMVGSDLDGDGDLDVIATLMAHGYGLAFYTQHAGADGIAFDEHVVVPNAVPAAGSEVILHEPHALALADVDRDGLPDVITGERFWGHVPEGMPDFDAPARLYWFRVERGADGVQLRPQLIDDDSGVGTQITSADLDADGDVDIAVANKKGAFVFLQQ